MRLQLRRFAKIVATLGPASSDPRLLAALFRAGVDVVRLNLSHGTRAGHARLISLARRIAADVGRPVAILADLQGAKARVGALPGGRPIGVRRGETVTLTSRAAPPDRSAIPTSYRALARDVRRGDPVLLDDGRIELVVVRVRGGEVVCRVVTGGLVFEHKGINLPLTRLSGPFLTRKDREDLEFVTRRRVDYVGLSFVRSARDVIQVRRLLKRSGREVPLIAKLEVRAAVERLEGILQVADGVMVARGDLGVEVPLERVPLLQKSIVRQANRAGVVVITATQMLESMVEHPRPTRAEASDVANAIFDGTDAVMLSAETATGRHPLKAVAVMDRIVRAAEAGAPADAAHEAPPGADTATRAVTHAAVDAAVRSQARAIVVYTRTGATARLLSKLKPPCAIIAFTPFEPVRRLMALFRGVLPLTMPLAASTDRMLADGERVILRERILAPGSPVVVVSGATPRAHAAHLMQVRRLGEPTRAAGTPRRRAS